MSQWPLELGDLEVFPKQLSQRLGHQMSVQAPFWEIPVTCSEAEGEGKDGFHWPQ